MPVFTTTVGELSPSGVLIRAEGELDLASVGQLRSVVERVTAPGVALLLDLRALAFCDSSGLRLLLDLSAEARRERREIGIRIGGGAVRRVVDLTHTAGLLTLVDGEAPATGAGGRPAE